MAEPGLGTRCVQAGYSPKNGEPRQIPIVQSTTFKYESSAEMGKLFDLEANGYFYSRLQNPTNDAVAARIAALEGGTAAMLTGSGMSAIFFAVFNIVSAGDHLVSSSSIYGGMADFLPLTGVTFPFVSNGGSSMVCVWGLLAFIKAADTRQNASFAIRVPHGVKQTAQPEEEEAEEADEDVRMPEDDTVWQRSEKKEARK